MGLSLQRLAQLCAMSESTETRVISNVNCRLLNYFKPSYDSKSSMILKEMGRVFTNWFCPPPAYEEELSDTRAEVQHALSSPDAGGRSRLLVSNRRLLQHSGTSRSGHCWAPEEFGTGHAPPAGSSQHPAALSSSELPCSRRSRAPGPGSIKIFFLLCIWILMMLEGGTRCRGTSGLGIVVLPQKCWKLSRVPGTNWRNAGRCSESHRTCQQSIFLCYECAVTTCRCLCIDKGNMY
nr:uncharacterized protein LOC110365253 isoform X28 [Columba livia]